MYRDSFLKFCFPSRSKPDIWFDNVDKFLIEGEPSRVTQASEKKEGDADDKLVKPDSYKGYVNFRF